MKRWTFRGSSHFAFIGVLLFFSFSGSNVFLSFFKDQYKDNLIYFQERKKGSETYTPYCESFSHLNSTLLYSKVVSDVESYNSDIKPEDKSKILAGEFPKTRFTKHVLSIVDAIDLEDIEEKCNRNFYFTLNTPFSTPSNIFCGGMRNSRMVPWWCQVFNQIFSSEKQWPSNSPFPGVLPSNLTFAISKDDFSNPKKEGYTCLANSSPFGEHAIINFLEIQRLQDKTSYPILNWTQKCTTPIWRGSAWREGGRINKEQESTVLQQVLSKSTRIQAVIFSKENPDLLDARISNSKNGVMSETSLWERNVTNGLDQLLPLHSIPSQEYYTQYQSALVLCGRGLAAAFRTPIHLSTATAVILQKCPYEEWYHPYMIPWKHYIPLDHELTNLSQTMVWIRQNPQKVYKIAMEGRQFYEQYLSFQRSYEHIYELVYRLALLSSKKNITYLLPPGT